MWQEIFFFFNLALIFPGEAVLNCISVMHEDEHKCFPFLCGCFWHDFWNAGSSQQTHFFILKRKKKTFLLFWREVLLTELGV